MNHDRGEISSTDLAELFRRNVNISSPTSLEGHTPSQSDLVRSHAVVEKEPASINYSISQHYTHSAHIVHAINAEQIPASQIIGPQPRDLSIYQLLAHYNISPSSLARSQLTLFEQADDDQRARLIQLWSLSPSHRTRNIGQQLAERTGEHQAGVLEFRGDLVWLHQQRKAFDQSFHREGELKYGYGDFYSWLRDNDTGDAETYITSGYEQLAQRDYNEQRMQAVPANLSTSAGLIFGGRYNHATDPIYQGRGRLDNHAGQQDVGQHRYNFRDCANRRHTQMEHVITIQEAEDQEML